MKRICFALVISLLFSFTTVAGEKDNDIADARAALEAFKLTDRSLDGELAKAAGYAVFNKIGKGGFVVGAAKGRGVVFDSGIPIGSVELAQVSIGLQAGGQTFSELILFQTEQALRDFQSNSFKLSAGASAVAATANSAVTAPYSNGIKILTLSKGGLMLEAAVGGQGFEYTRY